MFHSAGPSLYDQEKLVLEAKRENPKLGVVGMGNVEVDKRASYHEDVGRTPIGSDGTVLAKIL